MRRSDWEKSEVCILCGIRWLPDMAYHTCHPREPIAPDICPDCDSTGKLMTGFTNGKFHYKPCPNYRHKASRDIPEPIEATAKAETHDVNQPSKTSDELEGVPPLVWDCLVGASASKSRKEIEYHAIHIRDLIESEVQQAAERFRPLLLRPGMYFGNPIDKDALLAEFDKCFAQLKGGDHE